ncbi:MAG TPA: hypothetical protein VF628_11095 [Allosphingosinicella sp.]|jgi:hypothetical protein
MSIFFSPSTRGFYTTQDHADRMPADVVGISARRHRRLIAAQADGAEIHAGPDGCPQLRRPLANAAERRPALIAAVKREARRRIDAVAPLTAQINDNAALAIAAVQLAGGGSTTLDLAPALDRRARIDALRARSDRIEMAIAACAARDLAGFDPTADQHWLADRAEGDALG